MDIEIDFSNVKDLNSMHELLKDKFGFPEFYGKNVNALIDCWTSLRYKEDEMTSIYIGFDEILELKLKSLPLENLLILNNLLIAVQAVNKRYSDKGFLPAISLILV